MPKRKRKLTANDRKRKRYRNEIEKAHTRRDTAITRATKASLQMDKLIDQDKVRSKAYKNARQRYEKHGKEANKQATIVLKYNRLYEKVPEN